MIRLFSLITFGSRSATACCSDLPPFTAFDEDANFPCPGTVVGEEVEVLSVAIKDNRRELIATCKRNGHRYDIALLDVDLRPDPATSRLIAAYRRWLGY